MFARVARNDFQSKSEKFKSGSVMVTVIVINSEKIKVGNGNPIIYHGNGFLELRSRYL